MPDARETGSPTTPRRAISNGCAYSTPPRTNSTFAGGANTAAASAVNSMRLSVPSIEPSITLRDSATKYMKWRPSGRNCGWRSPCRCDSVPAKGAGSPPFSEMRSNGLSGTIGNRMAPSRFQVPPGPMIAGPMTFGALPSRSTRRSFSAAKNPIVRLSGDQKGNAAPSVPRSGRADPDSSMRTHN